MKQFISLGRNCDSRVYIKRELGLSKENGYNTCPFDLCMTPFDSLYKCIETDFEYFFHDLRLIPHPCGKDRPKNDCENKHAIINHYNIVFNHEGSLNSHLFKIGKNDDLFYIRNDFEEFKKRYQSRINNFRNYMSECESITFIIKYKEQNRENDLITLTNLLKEKYRNKNINIIEI